MKNNNKLFLVSMAVEIAFTVFFCTLAKANLLADKWLFFMLYVCLGAFVLKTMLGDISFFIANVKNKKEEQ